MDAVRIEALQRRCLRLRARLSDAAANMPIDPMTRMEELTWIVSDVIDFLATLNADRNPEPTP